MKLRSLPPLIPLFYLTAATVFTNVQLLADPIIDPPLISFSSGGMNATKLNSTGPFMLPNVGVNGKSSIVLTNGLTSIIQDFEFTVRGIQGTPITGSGTSFFSYIPAGNNKSINFFRGGIGTGIAFNQTFTITATGFRPGSVITAYATVPEPTSSWLIGIGLAAVFCISRKYVARPSFS